MCGISDSNFRIPGNLRVFDAIREYLRVFNAITGYLRVFGAIRVFK